MKEREREGERERQDEAREERGEISFGPCCFLRRVSAPLFRFLDLLQHKQKPDQCFPSFLNEQKDSLPFWIWTCCVSLFFLVFTVSPLSLSLSPPLPAVPVPLLSCSPSPSLSLALSRYSVGSQVKETKLKKKNSKILPQNSKEKKNTTFFRSNSERPLLLLVVCRQGRRHRRRLPGLPAHRIPRRLGTRRHRWLRHAGRRAADMGSRIAFEKRLCRARCGDGRTPHAGGQ